MDTLRYIVSGLFAALLFLPLPSQAVPVAGGSISANCAQGADYEGGSVSSSQTFSCNYSPSTVTTSATATANFALAPSLSATASAGGTASTLDVLANGSGSLQYYVSIVPRVAPPVAPVTIPVSFSARGDISVSGGTYATFSQASASAAVFHTSGSPLAFPTGAFSVNISYPNSGAETDGFNQTATLDLLPGPDLYRVVLGVGCEARTIIPRDPADPFRTVTAMAGCSASVDPNFAFDQAAFDAQMGTNSFALADYYKIELSPNLVPEPESVLLMGLGIVALVGLSWRSRSKAIGSLR